MVAPEGYDTALFASMPCVMVSQTEGEWLISNVTSAYSGGNSASGEITENNLVATKLWQYTSLCVNSVSFFYVIAPFFVVSLSQ